MNVVIASICFQLFIPGTTLTQIIQVPVNRYIPCCSSIPLQPKYADSLDINSDGLMDIFFSAMYSIDAIAFRAECHDDLELNRAMPFGSIYPENRWESFGTGMPSTPIGNTWGNSWLPNTGTKFLGFRRINMTADTTYGWVELDFRGEPIAPLDTLFILSYAYSSIPNVRLSAGQTSVTSISSIQHHHRITVFPNPTSSRLIVKNESSDSVSMEAYSICGEKVLHTALHPFEPYQTEIRDWPSGLYFLHITSGEATQIIPVMKF